MKFEATKQELRFGNWPRIRVEPTDNLAHLSTKFSGKKSLLMIQISRTSTLDAENTTSPRRSVEETTPTPETPPKHATVRWYRTTFDNKMGCCPIPENIKTCVENVLR